MTLVVVAAPMEDRTDEQEPYHERARDILQAEAEKGNGHAAHNLGTLYATGGIGIEPDPVEARRWMEVALATNFEDSVATDPTWFKTEE